MREIHASGLFFANFFLFGVTALLRVHRESVPTATNINNLNYLIFLPVFRW
jgi:hypothetical protein